MIRNVPRIDQSHLRSLFCVVVGHGTADHARADHRNLLPIGFCGFLRMNAMFSGIISGKTFQFPDGHRAAFLTAHTPCLTLAFLRTDPSADGRKGRVLADNLICLHRTSLFEFFNKTWDINAYRTALYTFCLFAAKTSFCFLSCLILIISITYFVKILCSILRLLFSYRNSL